MPLEPTSLSKAVRYRLVHELGMRNGLSPENIARAIDWYCDGELKKHPYWIERRRYAEEAEQTRAENSQAEHQPDFVQGN